MSKNLCRIFFFFAFLSPAYSGDVKPVEKLGKLRVNAPARRYPDNFKLQDLRVTFQINNKSKTLELGHADDVAAGQGCLDISYQKKYTYKAKQCGVVIREKQLTEINLAAIQLTWNMELFDVDFGPDPEFLLESSKLGITMAASISPLSTAHQSPVFVLPSTELVLGLEHPHTGRLFEESFSLSAGTFQESRLKAPDTRGKLTLHFADREPKFQPIDRQYMLVNYRVGEFPSGISRVSPQAEGKNFGRLRSSWRWIENLYRVNPTGEDITLKAFPLLSNNPDIGYEFSVNEQTVEVVMESRRNIEVPIATVNVHHYDTKKPGLFKMNLYNEQSNGFRNVLLPGGRTLYLEDRFLNTERSLFLPMGNLYRFDFYIYDDVGRITLQDQINLDLSQ